ncbi:MAG: LamG-like jellyroll fold domain-containing protein [Chloroflexota bacterium]
MHKSILTLVRFLLVCSLLLPVATTTGLPLPQAAAAPSTGYSISGRVTDSAGNPLSGITVRTSLNLTPIVFVHGFRGFPPQLIGCSNEDKTRLTDDAIGNAYFAQVDDLLSQYYPVYYAHLVSNPCYTVSLHENAKNLRDSINQAKSETGAGKVILIAHSMGGIVSRAYIENKSLYQGDVDTLFTLGSPHQGVQLDVLKELFGGWEALGLAIYCLRWGPAACQFSELGMVIENRVYSKRNQNVKYYTISGDAPWDTRNAEGKILDALMLFQANDGIIKQDSGLGLPGVTQGFPTDENHNVFGNGDYDWTYLDERHTGQQTSYSHSYTECLERVLVNGENHCLPSAGRDTERADFMQSGDRQRTSIEASKLLPGEIYTRTLQLESAATAFAASWFTGTVQVTLQAPDGTLIDADYALANPGVVSCTVGSRGAVYSFAIISGGQWKMILNGSDLPAGGTSVMTFATMESPLALQASSELPWYGVGDTAAITATLLGAPISSATLTARVTLADQSTVNVALLPVGEGNYRGEWLVSNVPGYAQATVTARGQLQDGDGFERGADLLFQISPNTISLANTYAETPQPHSPGSSFYASLDITVGVNVVISGTYGLTADLVDTQGQLVAHSLATENLPAGPGEFSLIFDGNEIFASGLNGPYTLTHLLLTDQNGAILVVDQADNAYTTTAYPYLSFGDGSPVIYLPIVVRNSNSRQTVHITQAPAIYTAQTDINGNYSFSDLPDGKYVVWPQQNGQNFTPASQHVNLPPNAANQNFTRQGSVTPLCVQLPVGLTSWWTAENTANDAIGTNHGTLTGGTAFSPGMVGQGFNLDGIDDTVRIPHSSNLNPNDSFTIEGWIYPTWDFQSTAFYNIFSKWGGIGDWQRAYSFLAVGLKLQFAISDPAHELDSSFHAFNTSSDVLTLNNWHHVAAVYDQPAGIRKIYVDGVLKDSRVDSPINITATIADATIGGRTDQDGTSEFFQGKIDELSFYQRALADSEIQEIYNAGVSGKCTSQIITYLTHLWKLP